jgi:taurine dioxygenase
MAPSLEEPYVSLHPAVTGFTGILPLKGSPLKSVPKYEPGRTVVDHPSRYEYEYLQPSFPDVKWGALEEVPYEEKGLKGDPTFKHLLQDATDVFDYNPKIGTEIHGVRLSQLNDAQKNDLARLIAIRGVVFFRNQDDLDIDQQRELTSYFGTLHKHATTSVPRQQGLEDVHVVYTDENTKDQRANFTPTFLWHSDVRSISFGVLNGTNTRTGHIRSSAPVLHLLEASHWSSSWRRR